MQMKWKAKAWVILLLLGFVIGIFYENFAEVTTRISIFRRDVLYAYWNGGVDGSLRLWYVFRMRVVPMLVLGMLGSTTWRKQIAGLFLLWIGFLYGVLVTAAIAGLGMLGLVVFLVGLFPQYLFYCLAYSVMISWMISGTARKWNGTKKVFTIGMLLIGVLAELYINPIIMKKLVFMLV